MSASCVTMTNPSSSSSSVKGKMGTSFELVKEAGRILHDRIAPPKKKAPPAKKNNLSKSKPGKSGGKGKSTLPKSKGKPKAAPKRKPISKKQLQKLRALKMKIQVFRQRRLTLFDEIRRLLFPPKNFRFPYKGTRCHTAGLKLRTASKIV